MHFANSMNFFSILTKVWDRRQVSSAKSGSFNCYEKDQLKKKKNFFSLCSFPHCHYPMCCIYGSIYLWFPTSRFFVSDDPHLNYQYVQ